MSFDIFDERFYLANNPDVSRAVTAGNFRSGLDHFQQYGIRERGRASSASSLYNEDLYLQANPDINNAVRTGAVSSGLQHYIQHGEAEGRLGVFGLYNEQAYLQRYPDVANAVQTKVYSSGFQHFVQNALPFGSTDSRFDALFNERYYLNKYQDVANAVRTQAFSSGLQHFLQAGLKEGRTGGANFNEGFYLRKYSDVAAAVRAGSLSSGLEHFARYGEAEGRSGTYFDEPAYRVDNADVAGVVNTGKFTSGAKHYLQFGQYEDARFGVFTGTSGNDIVRSFGKYTAISGVDLQVVSSSSAGPKSFGVGEFDILIGLGDGTETFVLGIGSDANTGAQKFYLGRGSSDYALIRYFNIVEDYIQLAGSPSEYRQVVVNGNLNISTSTGDLVGIVEGFSSQLTVFTEDVSPGTFLLG